MLEEIHSQARRGLVKPLAVGEKTRTRGKLSVSGICSKAEDEVELLKQHIVRLYIPHPRYDSRADETKAIHLYKSSQKYSITKVSQNETAHFISTRNFLLTMRQCPR